MKSLVKVFLTGGTGFIGSKLAEQLRGRGDEVVAAVRNPSKAGQLNQVGCEVVEMALDNRAALDSAMTGCDAVFHLAGHFEIGVPSSARESMFHSNVDITECVVDAAVAAGARRIVYASTINVFGNTKGAVVDETFRRQGDFLSLYDESKFRAHELVREKADLGAPIVLVQPGVVYGPGDHFEIGREILLAAKGKLHMLMLGDAGLTMAYVDDVASGFVLAHDKGENGECYVLGGEVTRLRDVIDTTEELAGKRPFRLELPTPVIKACAPLGPLVGPKLGYPPNFRELIRVSDRTTYWADDTKARQKLGYTGRNLEDGLRATLAAADH